MPQKGMVVLLDQARNFRAEARRARDLGEFAAANSALQRARATLREHLPPERREDWAAPEVADRLPR